MKVEAFWVLCLAVMTVGICEAATPPASEGHITGVGGVFFKAKDPKALATWYRDMLGLPLEAWGGAALHYDKAKVPSATAWNAFPATTKYFAPSTSGCKRPNGPTRLGPQRF